MSDGFCMRCKSKVTMKDIEQITNKQGNPMLKGKCPNCSSSVYRIMAKKKEGSVDKDLGLNKATEIPNKGMEIPPWKSTSVPEKVESLSPPIPEPPKPTVRIEEKQNFFSRILSRFSRKKARVEVLKDIPKLKEVIITNPDGKRYTEVSNKVKPIDYKRQKEEGVYYY